MPHPSTHLPHRVYGTAASGNCHKVRLALDLLRIPYRWHEIDVLKGDTRTPQFLAMNANGKVPLLQIDEHTFLPESNAILCYLADGTDCGRATGCSARRCCSGCSSSSTRMSRRSRWRASSSPFSSGLTTRGCGLHQRGHAALAVMEQHLTRHAFFAAERFSIADIALFAYTHKADEGGFDLAAYPAVNGWLDRCRARRHRHAGAGLTAATEHAMQRTPAIKFILITVLIDVMGVGLMLPVVPALVGEFAGSRESQAYWYGALTLAFGTMQFLCAPLLGALSDRYGRRPVLLVSIAALGLMYLLSALVTSLWALLATRILGGMFAANFSVASAYVADLSTPADRAKSFGLIGAAFGIGFIVGPMVGGLLGAVDIRLPFYVAAAIATLNFLYGLLVLPESLPPAKRRGIDWSRANPLGALVGLARCVTSACS